MLTAEERRLLDFELANRADCPAKVAGIRIQFAMAEWHFRSRVAALLQRADARAAYPSLVGA